MRPRRCSDSPGCGSPRPGSRGSSSSLVKRGRRAHRFLDAAAHLDLELGSGLGQLQPATDALLLADFDGDRFPDLLAAHGLSGDSELLDELTKEDTDADRLRVYAGYAGWAPGQLDGEIARGGWHVVPGDTAVVFAEEPADVWAELAPLPEPLSAGLVH